MQKGIFSAPPLCNSVRTESLLNPTPCQCICSISARSDVELSSKPRESSDVNTVTHLIEQGGKTRMLWSVLLVAAAMLVSFGSDAFGRLFSPDECGEIMWNDWFNESYYRPYELLKEDRDFWDGCAHRVFGLMPRDDVLGTRQECRTLSDESRRKVFGCFNRMANTGRMAPIEAMHRLTTARNAHFGSCFGPWHRIYLALVEEAMRTECGDRSICLCYWDPTLDSRLPNPCESAIFTDTYFGNENGPVRSGPYANKQCLPDCQVQGRRALTRQCGGAALPTEANIAQIINAPSYGALVAGGTGPRPIGMFERTHGTQHMFIGGHMAMVTCSPCDVSFFCLHSFYDLLLNLNFQRRGARPEQEYPQRGNPQFHAPTDRLLPFTGGTTCAAGLIFRPDSTPYAPPVVQCSDHDACGSKALWCDGGRCTACVRGGARMVRGWPNRACYIEGCDNPAYMSGTCGCARTPNAVQ